MTVQCSTCTTIVLTLLAACITHPSHAAAPVATPLVKAAQPAAWSTLDGCSVFPDDNIWRAPIATMPVDPNSAAYVATLNPSEHLRADFGSGLYEGAPIGIPYVTVPGNQPKVAVSFEYADESDSGPYPIPPNAPIEGNGTTGDRH